MKLLYFSGKVYRKCTAVKGSDFSDTDLPLANPFPALFYRISGGVHRSHPSHYHSSLFHFYSYTLHSHTAVNQKTFACNIGRLSPGKKGNCIGYVFPKAEFFHRNGRKKRFLHRIR